MTNSIAKLNDAMHTVFMRCKMKTKSVHSRLSKFRHFNYGMKPNEMIFQSRFNDKRYVLVIDQNGIAVTLPMVVEQDGSERVAYHPNTIKGLIEFLEGK
jgi:hypothetical protein